MAVASGTKVAAALETTSQTGMVGLLRLAEAMEVLPQAFLVEVSEEAIVETLNEKVQAGMMIETRSGLGISSFTAKGTFSLRFIPNLSSLSDYASLWFKYSPGFLLFFYCRLFS